MAYDLKEPVWNGNIDREEIRDADEDEQMTQISLTRFSGRYYSVACGPDIEFYKKKLDEAKECLNLPDDYDIPGCEWNIRNTDCDYWKQHKLVWFIGDEEAFVADPFEEHRCSGESSDCLLYTSPSPRDQ